MKDFGIISSDDSLFVVDRSKLRRECQKYRAEIPEEKALFDLVDALYLDGRTDENLPSVEVNGKHYKQIIKEHHYVIVGEPGEVYISQITTGNSQQLTIAKAVLHLAENTTLADKLIIIGTDGTTSMTGIKSGLTASLKKLLGRPLQWAICLLHLNQIPLRHVFQILDGTTTGPQSFAGPVGKAIARKVSTWQVTSFKKIKNDDFPTISNFIQETLSTDQYHAYKICQAVISGELSEDFELLEVG